MGRLCCWLVNLEQLRTCELRATASGFVWLVPIEAEDAKTVAKTLLEKVFLDLAMFLVSCGLRYLITWNGVVDMISVVSGFYRLGTLSHASTQWARSLK